MLGAVVVGASLALAAALAACGSAGSGPGHAVGGVSARPASRIPASAPWGTGSWGTCAPLVLIMGYGWTMEGWDPPVWFMPWPGTTASSCSTIRASAAPIKLPGTFSIDAMADQTGALIDTLGRMCWCG